MFLPPLAPNFDAALRDAGSRDARFRMAAAERLATPEPGREDEALKALRRLADDPLGPIREAALTGVGFLGDPSDLALLEARFDDGHVAVRQAAVRAAARIEADPSWLLPLLDDPREEMRFQAVDALAVHLPELAEAHLLPLLDDPDARVGSAAARALGALEAHGAADALAAKLDGPLAFDAAVALAELGDARGEPSLVRALADRQLALDATEALGLVATDAGRDALARTAERFFAPLLLRAAAGAALARRGDARSVAALDRVLRAWRADGRDYAVHAAGELGLADLVPALARLVRRLRGADPGVLAAALEALAEESEPAREALERLRRRFRFEPAES